jgi:hypothetical protein
MQRRDSMSARFWTAVALTSMIQGLRCGCVASHGVGDELGKRDFLLARQVLEAYAFKLET